MIRVRITQQKISVCTCDSSIKVDAPKSNVIVKETPLYKGSLEVIPSDEEQVLNTKFLKLDRDIVVKPIPSNYGKIECNGSELFII